MRKHFLILMLLTLLPLAGWAQTVTFGEVGIGKFTYGDTKAPTPVVKDSEGAILKETEHYNVTAGAKTGIFSDEACTVEVEKLSDLTAAAGKTYYREVIGIGAYVGQVAHPHFTVTKAPLTLTLKANALDRDYSDALVAIKTDGSQFDATGLKYSDAWPAIKKGSVPTYSTSSNNVGDYSTATPAKKLTFDGGWTPDNYEITYVGALTISQKDIAATATITAWQGNVVYTGKDITPKYTVKDKADGVVLTAGTDYTVSTAHNVGPYYPSIIFMGNYKGLVAVSKKFDVTPAPIVVSVKDIEVTYNGTDQADQTAKIAANIQYSGIVGDDIANAATIKGNFTAPTVLAVDGEAINQGNYVLKFEENAKTGTETNYEIAEYVPGNLTIKRADLLIKAKNAEKSFGEADPTFVVNPVAGLTITGVTFTREPGEDAGDYEITPDITGIVVKNAKKVDVKDNYNISIDPAKGVLTIGKGKIYVTINDVEKFYGEADPTFTYAVTGLKGTDELAAFEITREAGEAVKGYSLNATVANPNPEKYSAVVVAPGILTIKKAQLDILCDALSLKKDANKDEKAAALNKSLIKVEGINNSDDATKLYNLAYDGAVVYDTDNTDADGVELTLDHSKKLITENAINYFADDLYEIVTARNDDGTVKTVAATTDIKLIVGAGTTAAQDYTSVDTDVDDIIGHAGETQTVTINFAPRNARELPAGTARTWKAGEWTTMVLPFDISVAELSQVLGYAIVNVINPERTKVSGTKSEFYGKLTMKGGNGSDEVLKANKPFLVKIAEDMNPATAYNFGSKKLVKPTDLSVDAGEGCKFVGTYTTKTVTKDDDAAIWFMLGNLANWAYIGTTSSATWDIVPFEAYIDMSAVPAAARNLVFYAEELDGSVTAIKGINSSNASDAKQNAEGWYNLNGVKLQGAPSQKGIYINNGKKVVIK